MELDQYNKQALQRLYDQIEAELNFYRPARDSFLEYRKIIRPNMKQGWFIQEVTAALQEFYEDLVGGLRPKLCIEAPPQHGKSWVVVDFVTWIAGKNPDCKTIHLVL